MQCQPGQLFGEGDGRDHGVPDYLAKDRKMTARDLQKITKPLLYRKSQNPSQKPYFVAKKLKPY